MEYHDGVTAVYSSAFPSAEGVSPMIQVLMRLTPFIVGIICTLGVVFNGLIILHIMVWTKVKSLANTFILNLAVADLFFIMGLPFLGYQLAQSQWIFGPLLCRLIIPYDAMAQFTVVFFLVVMSLDRYLAFCQPIKSMHFRTLTHGRIISMVVWLASVIVSLPVWMFSSEHCFEKSDLEDPSRNITHCLCVAGVTPGYSPFDDSESNNSWFSMYTLVLDFCIPLTIICGCYLLILWNLIQNPLKEMSSTTRRASRRITVLVICIVFVFVTCFLPFFVVQLYVSDLKEYEDKHTVLYTVSWFLMYSHSIINPVVYTMIGVNFRQNILNCFRSYWKPKPTVQNADKTSSIRLCMSRSSMRYIPGTENVRQVTNGSVVKSVKQLDMRATELSALSKYEESI